MSKKRDADEDVDGDKISVRKDGLHFRLFSDGVYPLIFFLVIITCQKP